MQSIISEVHQLWGSSLFSKCSKFDAACGNAERNWANLFSFRDKWFWIGCVKNSLFTEREYSSLGVNMLTNSLKNSDTTKIEFFQTEVLSEWSKNITKLLPCRFKQCFAPFNMLNFHKCSDRVRFRHLSNHAFCSL